MQQKYLEPCPLRPLMLRNAYAHQVPLTKSYCYSLLEKYRNQLATTNRPLRTQGLYERGEIQPPLLSLVEKSPFLPVQETKRENEAREGLVLSAARQSTLNNQSPSLVAKEVETANTELQAKILALTKGDEFFRKKVQEKR